MQIHSFTWLMLLATAFLTTGCRTDLDEKLGCTDPRALNYDADAVYDDGECEYSDSYRYYMPEFWDDPDQEGNLLIVNQTESPLHLYVETEHKVVVPPKTKGFLVDVPVKSDVTQLSLYKAENVDRISNPPSEKFKSWRVVLASTLSAKGPVGWVVSDLVTGKGAGSLLLSYANEEDDPLQDLCNVDVYLHSKTGGRVTSVEAGTTNKEVRLDFGTYRLWFHYWKSDPGSSEGYQTIGWKYTEDLVLNAGNEIRNITIPPFDAIPENAAALKVTNQTGQTINVKLGDRLIENMVVGRENTQAMSTIADRDSMVYPVESNRYTVSFENLAGGAVGEGFQIDTHKQFKTEITAGQSRHMVTIQNQTERKLYLGTDHYLGIAIEGGQNRERSLPAHQEQVHVFNEDSTFYRELTIDNQTLTIQEQ